MFSLFLISPVSYNQEEGTFFIPSTLLLLPGSLCVTFHLLNSIISSLLQSVSGYHLLSIFTLLSANSQVTFLHSEDSHHNSISTCLPFPSCKGSSFVFYWLCVPPPKRWCFLQVPHAALDSLPFPCSPWWPLQTWSLFKCLSNPHHLLKTSLNYRLKFPITYQNIPHQNKLYQKLSSLSSLWTRLSLCTPRPRAWQCCRKNARSYCQCLPLFHCPPTYLCSPRFFIWSPSFHSYGCSTRLSCAPQSWVTLSQLTEQTRRLTLEYVLFWLRSLTFVCRMESHFLLWELRFSCNLLYSLTFSISTLI